MYHFNPADVSLRLLRGGDFRGNVARDHHLHWNLLAERVEVSGAHLSSFRLGQRHAAGKYAGGFRGFGAAGQDRAGCVDAEVNRLLDLETRREVSLCLVGRRPTKVYSVVEGADIVMKSSGGANAIAGCWPTSR